MISLGIYNHRNFYEDLLDRENFQVSIVESLTTLTDYSKFDLLLINISEIEERQYSYFLNNMQNLTMSKVIFLDNTFSIEQVKKLMLLGAYDCVTLPFPISDLLNLLTNAYTEITREKRQKRKQENYKIKSIRASLAYDLLHGNTKNAKEIWERSQLANLSLIPNTVLLFRIDHFSKLVKNKGELWKNSLRKEVLQAIKTCDLQYESLKVFVNQQKFAILLSLPVQLEERKYKILATEYAEKAREEINKQTDYTVTIGIGNYYEDARNLHLSYQESEQAQTYRLFQEENSIIHIDDLDYFETPEYYEYKIQIQEMTNKFSLGDITAVHTIWKNIYHSVAAHSHFQPEEFRLQVLDLLFSLSKTAMQNGANPKRMMPLQIKHAKELHEIESLAEIDTWMTGIINEYIRFVNEGHNEQVLKSVQEVLQYIEEHYSEDIGLEMIAEKVDLSPNYLSAIFKQTTGSSFIDYLTELRMKKAKENLQNLNLSVYEIAEAIGYSSSQYFSRVFKKHTGMTPSAYRNSILSTNK
ncbi:helix-turn-helix domain-containing protein [Pseudogracilibacillus sp. SO30301A]|uniref:helix-turn-helix domain-containing protein n=1 Tax=Pseudogracilibacillus sp. SO30301A TaxID=3098291 RepID=UPI00300E3F3D